MSDTTMTPKIEVKNFNFYYGAFHALKNINLSIAENKVTAFIGPSGCGKSTLLRTFNRMYELYNEQRAEGEIWLDGENIVTKTEGVDRLRSKVGMVFQRTTPFPMSIYDNIAYGPRTHGIRSKAKLDEIVEKSLRDAAIWDEVKDRLKKSALGMSGGQQQRVAIARAVVTDCKLLLADEPTGNLDSVNGIEVMELLSELNAQGTTIIIVTHSQRDAMYAHRVIQLLDGQIVAENVNRPLGKNVSAKNETV